MHRVLRLIVVGCAALSFLVPAGAHAADYQFVNLPGMNMAFVPPATAVPSGSGLIYTNIDVAQHDFVADVRGCTGGNCAEAGPSTNWWCAYYLSTGLPACPLFASDIIGLAKSTRVWGVEAIQPGGVYRFYCTLHPQMRGTLVGLPSV